MQPCAKCETEVEQDPHPVCSMCQVTLCAACAGISATEARVFRLQKYRLKFFCGDCEQLVNGFVAQDKDENVQEMKELYREVIKSKEQVILDKQKIIDILEDKVALITEVNASKYSDVLSKGTRGVNKQIKSGGEADKPHRAQTSETTGKPLRGAVQVVIQPSTSGVDREDGQRNVAEDGSSVAVDDWTLVDRKKKGRKIIHGTAEQAGKFTAAEKKAWFFVGRVKDGVGVQDVQSYVEDKLPGQRVDCEKLSSLGTSGCFKVGVDFGKKDTLEQESFWPKGVKVKQYKFFRGQPGQVAR